MKKKLALLGCIAALGVGSATPVAFAGTDNGTATEEEEGTDYGWIGLLGLAGLAGLLGRKRDNRRVDDDVAATTRR